MEVVRVLAARACVLRLLIRVGSTNKVIRTDHVETVAGRVDQAGSLLRAMRDVDTILVIPPNVRNQAEAEMNIYLQAARTGIRRVVKLSTSKADCKSSCYFFRQHALAEEYLRKCGVPFVIVRSNSFMQNLLWFAPEIRATSTFSLPMGNSYVAPVDIRDVAQVLVHLLLEPHSQEEAINVTGPAKLTFQQMASMLSRTTKRRVHYSDVTPEEFTKILRHSGMPNWRAKATTQAWTEARLSQPMTTSVVAMITKHQAINFKRFLRDHAIYFVKSS